MAVIEVKKENKLKKFWENHTPEIIAVGISTAVVGGLYLVANAFYKAGIIDGGAVGYNLTIDWLDKTFPGESNARELVTRYTTEHPEEVVTRKGLGKWS